MNGLADDIANVLVSAGLGTLGGATGWVINANGEPPLPDTALTVYDTGGQGLDTDEQDVEQPTFQVRARSKSQRDARSKLEEVKAALVRPGLDPSFDGPTSHFTGVMSMTDVLFIGKDGNDRFLFTVNYRTRRVSL